MSSHALLSASGAKRWLECPPSAVLEAQFPSKDTRYTREGSLAHSLAELQLRKWSEPLKPSAYKKALAEIQADELYSADMLAHVGTYVEYVKGVFQEAKDRCSDAILLLEQRLDYSDWVPEGFGTGDVVIIADGMLHVIDLKYGQGVAVDALENPQTRLYGAGAYAAFGMLYDFEAVQMTIFQPRLAALSSEILPLADLLDWLDETVRPRAALAAEGLGEFKLGDHCNWCRAKAICKARVGVALAVADFAERPVELLSPEEVADILPKLALYDKWSKQLKDYALAAAINEGLRFPGYKLVAGRSSRVISDAMALAARLEAAGIAHDKIFEPESVLGLGALEKNIGKNEFAALAGEFLIKPPGKPALVPQSDNRPELSSLDDARAEFDEDVEIDE